MVAPKLRFKDEQGQNYPAWKVETLCKCCTINPPSPKLPNTFIYIDLESVKQGRLLAKKIVLAKDAPSRAQRKVIVGDVLFQTVRPYQKNNFIVKTPETIPMIASTGYSVLRCNKNNSGYIYHETQTEKFSRNVQDRCTGGAYPAITGKELGKIKIPLPSLPEQQKIADFLSAYDRQIDIQSQRVEAMKTRKKGLLQKIFSQEIRFRNDEGKEFPEWELCKLGELFKERSQRANGDEELLSVTIEQGVLRQSDLARRIVSSEDKSNYKMVYKGDIAYNSMRMWQGAEGMSNYNGIVSPAYTIVVPKENVSSKFFAYMFKTEKALYSFKKYSQGLTSDTWNLKYPLFSKVPSNIPSLPEQQKIADFLTAVDKQIEVEEKRLETMKTIKKGLLQQMFI